MARRRPRRAAAGAAARTAALAAVQRCCATTSLPRPPRSNRAVKRRPNGQTKWSKRRTGVNGGRAERFDGGETGGQGGNQTKGLKAARARIKSVLESAVDAWSNGRRKVVKRRSNGRRTVVKLPSKVVKRRPI